MAEIKADPEGFAERFGQTPITDPEIVSISNYSMISFTGKQPNGQSTIDVYTLPLYGNFYILGVVDTCTQISAQICTRVSALRNQL